MTDFKVTDEAFEAAFNAWCDVADVGAWRVTNSRKALRFAIEALLPVMFEPAAYRPDHPEHPCTLWFEYLGNPPLNYENGWTYELAYRIKEPK